MRARFTIIRILVLQVSPEVLLLLHPLYWAQYCINILIYVFMNSQYRDAYVNYISQWWPNFKEVSEGMSEAEDSKEKGDQWVY